MATVEAARNDERLINEAAVFLPMTTDDEKPCIEVAGAQVYAYVQDGTLVVSVHLDTADKAVFATYGPDDGLVPVEVTVGADTVYASAAYAADTGRHRRR
jgi:hypothetical protein